MAKAGLLFVGTDDGVLIFSDPGASGRWLKIGHELQGMHALAVWPLIENPQVVLVGGPGGLWRSSDGGQSWLQIFTSGVSALQGPREQPELVEAFGEGGWQRSEDAGRTWAALDRADVPRPLAVTLPGNAPVAIEARGAALARSEDGGAAWQVVEPPLAAEVSALAVARYHMDTAYAGSAAGELAVSTDRGRTWQILKRDLPPIRSIVATRIA